MVHQRGLPLYHLKMRDYQALFWDLTGVRYSWQLSRVPKFYDCGAKFSSHHILLFKKEGFISVRQNYIWDVTANLLEEVYRDVRTEPKI